MPLLEELDLTKMDYMPSIKDVRVSPLSHCKKLKKLNMRGNQGIEVLCQFSDLQELNISDLPLIKNLSFFEKGFANLRFLTPVACQCLT